MSSDEIEKRLKLIWKALCDQQGPICRKYSHYPNDSIMIFAKLSLATTNELLSSSTKEYFLNYCWNTNLYKMPTDCRQIIYVSYGMGIQKTPLAPLDSASGKFPIAWDDTIPYGKIKICAWDMINKKYLEF